LQKAPVLGQANGGGQSSGAHVAEVLENTEILIWAEAESTQHGLAVRCAYLVADHPVDRALPIRQFGLEVCPSLATEFDAIAQDGDGVCDHGLADMGGATGEVWDGAIEIIGEAPPA
jgi:hypothetical protein